MDLLWESRAENMLSMPPFSYLTTSQEVPDEKHEMSGR